MQGHFCLPRVDDLRHGLPGFHTAVRGLVLDQPLRHSVAQGGDRGSVWLFFPAAAAQREREPAMTHCSLQVHIPNMEMPAAVNKIVCEDLISLNTVFGFEWWIGFNLLPRLTILRKVVHFAETRQLWRDKGAPNSIHNKW